MICGFFKVLFPVASQMPGGKVLICDNLGSHFSTNVIKAYRTNNILFICLPPNSTHLCQPLDVAVSRALKVEWKDIFNTWRHKSKSKANLPKTIFPGFTYFKFLKTVSFTPDSKSISRFEQSCHERKLRWDRSFPIFLICFFFFLEF